MESGELNGERTAENCTSGISAVSGCPTLTLPHSPLANLNSPPPPAVAVLGAGMMGTAIAAAHLRCAIPVVLYDSIPEALHRARVGFRETGDDGQITFTEDLKDIIRCPVLIETITEKLKAKQKLYKNIVKLYMCSGQPCFPFVFTNTSTISITCLSEELPLDWQQRFCGFHFFHPVKENPVIEIIAGKKTLPETADFAVQHALRLEKQPVCTGDGPGFLVNRILNGYLSAALQLLESGESIERIDNAATDFGMRMGPFRIMDEIGLDVVLHSGWILHKTFPDRVPKSEILVRMVEQGKLGVKTGTGFLQNNEYQTKKNEPLLSDEELIRRLIEPMHEEAVRCVEDGIISDLAVADFVLVNALGFPQLHR